MIDRFKPGLKVLTASVGLAALGLAGAGTAVADDSQSASDNRPIASASDDERGWVPRPSAVSSDDERMIPKSLLDRK